MAYFDHDYVAQPSVLRRLAALFDTPFDRRSRRLAAQVAELRALSDAELEALGIAREDILFHVFGARR